MQQERQVKFVSIMKCKNEDGFFFGRNRLLVSNSRKGYTMYPVEKLRKWMAEKNYEGVILNRRDNYMWITGGAQNHVCSNTENGVAYYVIEPEKISLFADSSDLPRVSKEQNPLGAEAVLVPWYESMGDVLEQMIGGRKFVSDSGVAGTCNVQEELIDLRMQLSEEELERYREIGQECAHIVEGVCKDAKIGMTENEVAADLKCRCIKAGISPDCVLVGADERILNFRHPMPTDKKIENSLMVVLGGEKYGLNISMTRFVYFQPLSKEMRQRFEKTANVFANMQAMMAEGLSYADYFEKVKKLYKEVGYEDEWKMHHQGGPTGYGCREFVITPENQKCIHDGQAYAWNPTIQGTKCEETTFLTEKGIEIFTRTKEWPVIEVETEKGVITAAGVLER